jgi:hypothetical protein
VLLTNKGIKPGKQPGGGIHILLLASGRTLNKLFNLSVPYFLICNGNSIILGFTVRNESVLLYRKVSSKMQGMQKKHLLGVNSFPLYFLFKFNSAHIGVLESMTPFLVLTSITGKDVCLLPDNST